MQTLRSKTTHEPAESKLQHDAKQSSATLSAAAARRCLVCDIECHQAEQFEQHMHSRGHAAAELAFGRGVRAMAESLKTVLEVADDTIDAAGKHEADLVRQYRQGLAARHLTEQQAANTLKLFARTRAELLRVGLRDSLYQLVEAAKARSTAPRRDDDGDYDDLGAYCDVDPYGDDDDYASLSDDE